MEKPTKEEMVEFIQKHLGPIPPEELTTLEAIKPKIQQIKNMKWDIVYNKMAERGIHHDDLDDLEDDEDLIEAEQADEYIRSMSNTRVRDEKENIKFARDVSLVTRKNPRRTLPKALEQKIQTYGVVEPDNPVPEFDVIDSFGGKKGKGKSRKNKKKTRRTKRTRRTRRTRRTKRR